MGFRSTLCSSDYPGTLPEWFKEKYQHIMLFPQGILVVSKKEAKFYDNEFFINYQMALIESGFWDEYDLPVRIAVLAEDGVVSQVVISKDDIDYFWMDFGDEMAHVWMGGNYYPQINNEP